jgi:hypothetical protein
MDKYIIISPHKMSTNIGFGEGGFLAGMATEGTAHIAGVSHVGLGYEKLDHQLHLLGASIQRLCRNPSFGLATKARGCKVAGLIVDPGVTSHAPGSAKSVRE